MATTATNEPDAENSIHVFPNPASDIINIDLRKSDQPFESVRLLNVFGQVMSNQALEGEEKIIFPVTGFTPGVYYLLFELPEGVLTRKVMISR
jgi:hypothetical protein